MVITDYFTHQKNFGKWETTIEISTCQQVKAKSKFKFLLNLIDPCNFPSILLFKGIQILYINVMFADETVGHNILTWKSNYKCVVYLIY